MSRVPIVKPVLKMVSGPRPGSSFEVKRKTITLGRDPSCDIVLSPKTVSRRHARIVHRDDGYYLEDLRSTSGTLLNGRPLHGPTLLSDGDHIRIGDCLFSFSGLDNEVRSREDDSPTILGLRDVSGTAERALADIRPEQKLRALLEISRTLVGALDLEDVLGKVIEALFRLFPQADRGFVLLEEEGHDDLVLAASRVRSGDADRPILSRTVLKHVMREGKAVLSADATTDSRFGGSRSIDEAQIRTLMCVPLRDHTKRPVGVLQVDTTNVQAKFRTEDLDLLAAIAGQVSVAVDNARLLDRAWREQKRLAFLAEAGAVLNSSLDYEGTLNAVARLTVPRLADMCLIEMRQDDGSIRQVAAAHADPFKQELVDELRHRYAPDAEGPQPAMQVLRTGKSQVATEVDEEMLRTTIPDAEHQAIVHHLGCKSYMMVPLTARGRTLGVLSLICTESSRRYNEADLALTEELARRAALAVDNARLYSEAQAANRAKDQFLAVLSHELRTPLTPVLIAVSSSLENGDAFVARPTLEMIRRNIELESRLIDDLLDVSRIARGDLRLNPGVVDIHRAIQRAVEICRNDAGAASLEIESDLSATEYHVRGDDARLLQLFWNLIRNAAKFTPSGGTLTIRSRNEPASPPQSNANRIVIEFQDTGIGIDPEVLPRIFDPFVQGDPALRSRIGGLGLGLAISRAVAKAHGGRLSVTSPGRDRGTTFSLELATVLAPAPAAQPAPPPPREEPRQRPLKILLVEDNKDTLRYLALVLRRRRYEVIEAENLAAARMAASEGVFDLLISDIELPDGTGLELIRELGGVRVAAGIAMSGFGSEEDVRLSREHGFADHLTKPVDIERLEAAIARL